MDLYEELNSGRASTDSLPLDVANVAPGMADGSADGGIVKENPK